MYQNPYYNNYNQQMFQQPIPQQPITQNFQLSPNHTGMRFANSIDDVKKELVYFETPYFSRDMNVMWIKNIKGEIIPYEIKRMVIKDEKDMQMEEMQRQIDELKEKLNEKSSNDNGNEPIKDEKSSNVSNAKSRKN